MKKRHIYLKLIKMLEHFQCNIEKLKNNLRSKINIECTGIFYSDLMPKDEVDKVKTYHEALDWAIKHNSKIRNIALSGPYGAGKSTIIESYKKKSNIKEDKFLPISLATFNEENKGNQQLIEKSILEQMIYRVDGKKTPFSRVKKIKKISRKTIWESLIIGIIFLVSGWLLYNSSSILKLQNIFTNPRSIIESIKVNWLTFIISILFIITLIMVLYYLIYLFFKSFKIAKIKFDKTEIEISATGDDKESIYNKYIDELLYFFEETQYEIVIFEDIDRFDNSSIFTNLREINTFLNNYEKINRRIIFLYAIKDICFQIKTVQSFLILLFR